MDKQKKIEEAEQVLKAKGNIIKTRDDRELILVDKEGNVSNKDDCSWSPENDDKVDKKLFRTRIEPWLTSLFQSEHLSLLCGSGITNAISHLATSSSGTTMGATSFAHFKNEIEEAAKASAKASGREEGNIEDQIRTAFDLYWLCKVNFVFRKCHSNCYRNQKRRSLFGFSKLSAKFCE